MRDSAARFQSSCLHPKEAFEVVPGGLQSGVTQQDGQGGLPDDWAAYMVLGVCCSVPCNGVEQNCLTPAVPAEVLGPLVAGFKALALRNCASQASL